MNFAMFFILIFFMVDKHVRNNISIDLFQQIFAKQVSLSTLLVFIYIAVYMKFPKDGDKENEIAQLVNQIPYFKMLTINEVVSVFEKLIGIGHAFDIAFQQSVPSDSIHFQAD